MNSRYLFYRVVLLAVILPIAAIAQTQITSIRRVADNVTLHWRGGFGPWLVETSGDLQTWADQGELTTNTSVTLSASAGRKFYRLVDVNPTNAYGAFFGLLQSEQGEFGKLLARHRLKSRFWLYKTRGTPHTSPTATPLNYWRKLLANYQHIDGGRVRTWSGPLETLGAIATPTERKMTVTWSRGSRADLRTFVLTLDFPYSVTTGRAATLPSDPTMELKCTYATAQPEWEIFDRPLSPVTNDTTTLIELATDLQPWWPARNYRVSKSGVEVNLHYIEGLPLFQGSPPFIFKTLILDRWLSPSTGSGGSLPAFRTDSWFARTHLPGHHNFVETVLIEPALDPTLSETARAALATANIRYVYTFKDIDIGVAQDDIRYIGFDHRVRNP